MIEKIHWLGHDTFKIEGEVVIYTDPYQLRRTDTANIILITHEHFDHCSPEDVQKLRTKDTLVVAPIDCASKLGGKGTDRESGRYLFLGRGKDRSGACL